MLRFYLSFIFLILFSRSFSLRITDFPKIWTKFFIVLNIQIYAVVLGYFSILPCFFRPKQFFSYMPIVLHFSLDSSHFVTCQYFIYLASHLVDVVFLIKSFHKVIPKHSPGDSQTFYWINLLLNSIDTNRCSQLMFSFFYAFHVFCHFYNLLKTSENLGWYLW